MLLGCLHLCCQRTRSRHSESVKINMNLKNKKTKHKTYDVIVNHTNCHVGITVILVNYFSSCSPGRSPRLWSPQAVREG